MSILFYCQNDPEKSIENHLRASLPDMDLRAWPDHGNPAEIRYAVCWGAPGEFFDDLINLEVVFSLAAGVDHVLEQQHVPKDVPLVRLLDAGMGEKMAEFVLYGVLHAHRNMPFYQSNQKESNWVREKFSQSSEDFEIGILGLGTLGTRVAERLLVNGYSVHGWSRSKKSIPDIKCWSGNSGLQAMLGIADVIVCLLPLTDETRGILDEQLFAHAKSGFFLINVARGKHLNDEALLDALARGHCSGALLDVTEPEPLPPEHAFWQHPNIMVTPHISAPTQERLSIQQISDNIIRHRNGESLVGIVDRTAGY